MEENCNKTKNKKNDSMLRFYSVIWKIVCVHVWVLFKKSLQLLHLGKTFTLYFCLK